MNVNLIDNKILVKPEPKEEVRASGIVLPTQAQSENYYGDVVAVGPGLWQDGKRTEMLVKVGDKVWYPTFAGTKITYQGEEMVVMPESQVHFFFREA